MNLSIPNHWKKLGVPIRFGNPLLERNQFKLVKSSESSSGAKVFFIDITNSPLFVIDVDNVNQTVEKFNSLARSNGGMDDLVWETSRNGGYHLFFHSREKHNNILHKSFNGLYIDVIFKGRIFTSPSSWDGKSYLPGERSILCLSSLDELPVLPEWIDDLLCQT